MEDTGTDSKDSAIARDLVDMRTDQCLRDSPVELHNHANSSSHRLCIANVVVLHITTLKYPAYGTFCPLWVACLTFHQFARKSEMKQNLANFAACLSIICRVQSIIVKYSQTRLNR